MKLPLAMLVLISGLQGSAYSAPFVQLADFIPDGLRTGFMGFETLPDSANFGAVHQEGGIRIEQVNGDVDGISTVAFRPEGNRGWYPNGGDFGYTRLTLAAGGDFTNVGFLLGSGLFPSSPSIATYNLINDGVVVLSGNLRINYLTLAPTYLGFSGGGFDAILLSDSAGFPAEIGSLHENALAIDAIEISGNSFIAVPEQSAFGNIDGVMSALALAGVAVLRRRSLLRRLKLGRSSTRDLSRNDAI